MIKLMMLLVLLSSPAAAQWDKQYLEFSNGEYAEIPFLYPSILGEEDVTDVIHQLAELTGAEISYIQYHPVSGRADSENEILVELCEKGTRSRGACDQGWLYFFRKTDDRWVYQNGRRGSWAN